MNKKDSNSNENKEEYNEILENIDKKFDIKQEIINYNNDLKKIDNNVYWYFHCFFKKEQSHLKEDIYSLSELKEKFYIIGEIIDSVYKHCSESERFCLNFKKCQKYIDEILKPKYEIQKIKMEIEIIKIIDAVIYEHYIDFIDANFPYFD